MFLLRLMQGVRERGHEVLLFGVAGTRLWDEAGKVGIERVAWRSIQTEDGRLKTEDLLPVTTKTQRYAGGRESNVHSLKSKVSAPSQRSAVCGLRSALKRFALRLTPDALKLLAGSLREIMHLRRLFKYHPVDVMHVSLSGYEVAGVAGMLAGIPCLGMNETMPVNEPNSFRKRLMIWTAHRYSMVCAPSKACMLAWQQLCRLPAECCSFVWHGADLQKFQEPTREAESGSENSIFRLLTVCRLHPMKGLRYLIEAIGRIENRDVALTIAGDGPERKTLEMLSKRLGVQDRVYFLGNVEAPALLFRNADAFAVVSVSHESFCIALAEAMAAGLPVITSDFGPLPELNLDGQTGIVVKQHDPVSLVGAIQRLASDRSLCRHMGQAAKARAAAGFGIPTMIEGMLSLYERIQLQKK